MYNNNNVINISLKNKFAFIDFLKTLHFLWFLQIYRYNHALLTKTLNIFLFLISSLIMWRGPYCKINENLVCLLSLLYSCSPEIHVWVFWIKVLTIFFFHILNFKVTQSKLTEIKLSLTALKNVLLSMYWNQSNYFFQKNLYRLAMKFFHITFQFSYANYYSPKHSNTSLIFSCD